VHVFADRGKIAGKLEPTRWQFEGNFMSRHGRDALTFGCALALATFATVAARGEFPPEGAVTDPNNPSVASGEYPDPAHNGVTRHYVFYFDCGKRVWIGVSVAEGNQSAPPQAVGKGREFPSGPPPGAKVDAGNSNHASLTGSGQTFSLRQGIWFDVKTGKPVVSPNLCPVTPDQKLIKRSKNSEHGVENQQPDQLPPPPQFLPNPAARSSP